MSQEMSKILRQIVANNVKKYRSNQKMSREKLSLLIGMDNSYISKLEKSRINTTLDTLEKIADALDIPVLELFNT